MKLVKRQLLMGAAALAGAVLTVVNPVQALPTVTEAPFSGLVDGLPATGIEFTILNNTPTPGDVFAMVAFVSNTDFISESMNGFGYQTISDSAEWNDFIVSDGVFTVPAELSWFDLFGGAAGLGDDGAAFLDSGLIGMGYFARFEEVFFNPGSNGFTIGSESFIFSDPSLLIGPGQSQDGFLAIDQPIFSTDFFFASSGPNGGTPILSTFNNDPNTVVPEPVTAALSLMAIGALGLATRRRVA